MASAVEHTDRVILLASLAGVLSLSHVCLFVPCYERCCQGQHDKEEEHAEYPGTETFLLSMFKNTIACVGTYSLSQQPLVISAQIAN